MSNAPGKFIEILNQFILGTLDPVTYKILKIQPSELINYSSEFFYSSDEAPMIFRCPDRGETTQNSTDPRIELGDTIDLFFTETRIQTGKLKILQGSSTNHMIFAQLKGREDGQELCLVHWRDDKIYARIKPVVSKGPKDAINFDITEAKIGEFINYELKMSNKVLTLTINDKTISCNIGNTYDKQPLYFKAGCYLKDNSNSGTFGKVGYFELKQYTIPTPTPTPTGSVPTVKASDFDDEYRPENTLDNDTNTRWSANGKKEWIQYDFKTERLVKTVDIMFHKGDKRVYKFDVWVSNDEDSWSKIKDLKSNGKNLETESFKINLTGRYIRIVGRGTTKNSYNSYINVTIQI